MKTEDRELRRRFEEAYDDNGVDRSLIRENLRLTPAQRLANLEGFLRDIARIRRVSPATGTCVSMSQQADTRNDSKTTKH